MRTKNIGNVSLLQAVAIAFLLILFIVCRQSEVPVVKSPLDKLLTSKCFQSKRRPVEECTRDLERYHEEMEELDERRGK